MSNQNLTPFSCIYAANGLLSTNGASEYWDCVTLWSPTHKIGQKRFELRSKHFLLCGGRALGLVVGREIRGANKAKYFLSAKLRTRDGTSLYVYRRKKRICLFVDGYLFSVLVWYLQVNTVYRCSQLFVVLIVH